MNKAQKQHERDLKNLSKTSWAQSFKQIAPKSYDYAAELSIAPYTLFCVYITTDTGEPLWVIAPDHDLDFWMSAFNKKIDALTLCTVMGWCIKKSKLPKRPVDDDAMEEDQSEN